MPGQAVVYQNVLIDFNSQDQYPTEVIYIVFNFTETEAISDTFESFGYENKNFMELTGSLLITQCISVVSFILNIIFKIFALWGGNYWMCRQLGMKLP